MNKLIIVWSLFGIFMFQTNDLFARQDTLFVYTKADCSNCQATKKALKQLGIGYFEKDLNNAENAREMLHKLTLQGYKDKIYLPVIFLNKNIYHPAYRKGEELAAIDIESAIDSLKQRYFNEKLQLYSNEPTLSEKAANPPNTVASDCEVEAVQIYLICAGYPTESEAVEAMRKLIANGYSYAGIIFSNNSYLVYNKFFFDKAVANQQLIEAKKIFSTAWLFEN